MAGSGFSSNFNNDNNNSQGRGYNSIRAYYLLYYHILPNSTTLLNSAKFCHIAAFY